MIEDREQLLSLVVAERMPAVDEVDEECAQYPQGGPGTRLRRISPAQRRRAMQTPEARRRVLTDALAPRRRLPELRRIAV